MGTLRSLTALVVALPFVACTGFVDGLTGDGTTSGPATATPTAGQPSVSGSSGAGGVASTAQAIPGAPVIRRLNHLEYNRTVRDLLETSLRPADGFPADDFGAEFTTVGSSLSLSPTYVRAYEQAAYQLLDDLFKGPAERLAKVVNCAPQSAADDCTRGVVSSFASRAWRRPVTDEEVQALLAPVTTAIGAGLDAREGVKYALAGVLLSPHFLFKVELDKTPITQAPRELSPHELATRLSYALWGTLPDTELRRVADAGELQKDETLSAQVDRLLADDRTDALVAGFATEWLDLEKLTSHEVEDSLFPDYSSKIATAMRAEATGFFAEFLRSSQPVSELFTARFTFVNDDLASWYGLQAPAGTGTRKVDTTGSQRAGLLTLGSFLTTTSYPTRTSPVRRGEFVFSRFMCGEVPSPPMDVPSLPPDMPGLTLRERTELHRANPACAACHTLMDPLGFGLESYDAVGRFRTMDAGDKIDSSGVLPSGAAFNGAVELGAVLSADPRTSACLTRKLLTNSVGRLFGADDDAWVQALTDNARQAGGSLRATLRAIVLSPAFRSRQQRPE